MTQQTAVEWLKSQIELTVDGYFGSLWAEIFEKAKEMEKEQIGDAFDNGCVNIHIASNSIGIPYNKEKYYNETYGK